MSDKISHTEYRVAHTKPGDTMTETEKAIERRREEEEAEGIYRGVDRDDTDEESENKSKYGIRVQGSKWVVFNKDSGKVLYSASSETAAIKKREDLIGEKDSFLRRMSKKVLG